MATGTAAVSMKPAAVMTALVNARRTRKLEGSRREERLT